ncbi:hypothetical protein [Roseibium sp.]|uniref:hypothetical protein n=1 Tax=Roseibium sp. TaxID=1936156 RepID=UPI003A9776AB
MRVLSAAVSILAVTAFVGTPAMACEWAKTAKAKSKMSVAQTSDISDIAIATNDLPDDAVQTPLILPKPESGKAE